MVSIDSVFTTFPVKEDKSEDKESNHQRNADPHGQPHAAQNPDRGQPDEGILPAGEGGIDAVGVAGGALGVGVYGPNQSQPRGGISGGGAEGHHGFLKPLVLAETVGAEQDDGHRQHNDYQGIPKADSFLNISYFNCFVGILQFLFPNYLINKADDFLLIFFLIFVVLWRD